MAQLRVGHASAHIHPCWRAEREGEPYLRRRLRTGITQDQPHFDE
jgi:hypothetical protein